jgi:flagellin-like hook-associated protein FlgL
VIGGLSSWLSTALRTAGEARARMDRASRELATGKEVHSARDDGARYAQSVALASQRTQAEVRRDFHISNIRQVVETQATVDLTVRENMDRMADIIRQAMVLAPGSASRQQLAAEWQQVLASFDTIRGTTGSIESGMAVQVDNRWGIRTTAADPIIGDRTIWTMLGGSPEDFGWHTIDVAANGVPYGSIDILNHTQAQLQAGLTTVQQFRDTNVSGTLITGGRNQNWLDRIEASTNRDIDRFDTMIGALTDADLGAASSQLRMSQTREQLALATVRQALDAYGSFANGLLGNVQRTQRALA